MDSREPKYYQETISRFLAAEGVECLTTALVTGDYTWLTEDGKQVTVERKEAHDLISSLTDGRWQEQFFRLSTIDIPILLIEGDIRNAVVDRRGGWTEESVESALMVAQLGGLYVSRCPGGSTSVAGRLRSLYRSLYSGEHSSLIGKRQKVVGISPSESVSLGLLTALPGLGEKTARKILKEYGDVGYFFDQLRYAVPGFCTDSLRGARIQGIRAITGTSASEARIFEWASIVHRKELENDNPGSE